MKKGIELAGTWKQNYVKIRLAFNLLVLRNWNACKPHKMYLQQISNRYREIPFFYSKPPDIYRVCSWSYRDIAPMACTNVQIVYSCKTCLGSTLIVCWHQLGSISYDFRGTSFKTPRVIVFKQFIYVINCFLQNRACIFVKGVYMDLGNQFMRWCLLHMDEEWRKRGNNVFMFALVGVVTEKILVLYNEILPSKTKLIRTT